MKKRKIFLLLGFFFLTISKPLLAFSTSYIQIFLVRSLDRLGNGLQASPRDALIGDLASKENKGACYGFRQSLALIGSTIGGILGICIMNFSNNNYKLLFILISIPAILAFFVVLFFVKDKANVKKSNPLVKTIKITDITLLGKQFWALMIVTVLFTLGRFSEVLICILACEQFGLSVSFGPMIPIIYSLVSALISFPIGKLSDSINNYKILLLSLLIFTISHLTIGLAQNIYFLFFGVILWGLFKGIIDNINARLIIDFVPKELRGTGFSLYSLLSSISMVLASSSAGYISDLFGQQFAFLYGALTGLISIFTLLYLKKYFNK